MTDFTRRTVLQGGTAFAAAAALSGAGAARLGEGLGAGRAVEAREGRQDQPDALAPLRGGRRRGLREDDRRLQDRRPASTSTVTNESFEDIQPKASVVANTGQGLDMVWGLYSLPHLFPAKCMDLTDVANYLGKKYGGWTPAAEAYGKSGNKWIGIPVATTGGLMNYRISSMEKAGFKEFPKDTAGFLELVQGAEEEQHAGRLRARPRLGRRQHLAALGAVGAWRQPGRQERQGHHQLAGDREGARIRQGAVRELHPRHGVVERLVQQQDLRRRRPAPHLERHLDLRGGAEGEQGGRRRHEPRLHADRSGRQADRAASRLPDPHLPVHQGAAGLQGADARSCWKRRTSIRGSRRRRATSRTSCSPTTRTRSGPPIRSARSIATSSKRTLTPGGQGSLGEKAAAAIADFIVVDMFANFATGREDAKGAIAVAERQAKRIYR